MDANKNVPHHIAFIPNGNRRYARRFSISLDESYRHGAMVALDVAGWAREAGVKHVTFFGLSCENMKRRSRDEIDALIEGAHFFCDEALKSGTAVHAFGNIREFKGEQRYAGLYERLSELQKTIPRPDDFVVHVAANYSGSEEIPALLRNIRQYGIDDVEADWKRFVLSAGVPPVDMVVRTGGESRTSGILPFQVGYSELCFLPFNWGEFNREEFMVALEWFSQQERNFGK